MNAEVPIPEDANSTAEQQLDAISGMQMEDMGVYGLANGSNGSVVLVDPCLPDELKAIILSGIPGEIGVEEIGEPTPLTADKTWGILESIPGFGERVRQAEEDIAADRGRVFSDEESVPAKAIYITEDSEFQ